MSDVRPQRSRPRRRHRRLRPARMVKVVPSMFTLANLLCGFAAIVYASRSFDAADRATYVLGHWDPLTFAATLVLLGMIFDALDGRVARITRQTSELGEQLDSMADMVTFGVAPAFLLIELVGMGTPFFGTAGADTLLDRIVLATAGVYVACCALRLARFNLELSNPGESAHLSFKGLPSPAAAGTVVTLVLLHQHLLFDHPTAARFTGVGMVLIALLVAAAMVSSMRYTHLLNRYLRGRAPFHYVATGVILLLPLLIFPQFTLALGFSAYALSTPTILLWRLARRQNLDAWMKPPSLFTSTGDAGSAPARPPERQVPSAESRS